MVFGSSMAGSSKSSPPPPAGPPPIFVADKLFGEFALGRINPSNAKIGSPSSPSKSVDFPGDSRKNAKSIDFQVESKKNEGAFHPSAPPFECIGRSTAPLPAAAPIFGLDDIFGGLPGIKCKSSAVDDVFVMASSNAANGTGSSDISSNRSHQRSSSCTTFPTLQPNPNTNISPKSDAATVSSWSQSTQSQQQSSSNGVLPKNNGRPNLGVGGPGLSRFGATETREKDAAAVPPVKPPPQEHTPKNSSSKISPAPSKNPGIVTSSPKTPPIVTASSKQQQKQQQQQPMGSADATTSSPSHSSKGSSALPSNRGSSSSASSSPRQSGGSDMASLAPKLQPEDILLSRDKQETTPSPRRSKRQSATDRLKAVLFPDSGKHKEEKSGKNKGWLTVGELKLVTQPTEVPPPTRAPPETVRQANDFQAPQKRRDDRWRRKSCEFPSGAPPPPRESWGQSGDSEDFAGISTSAAAMKEAVERAEAKIREKQKSGELGKTDAGIKVGGGHKVDKVASHPAKVVSKDTTRHQEGEREVEFVERAAHELREKALKKAAERALGIKFSGPEAETSRSASAPKHRVSDESELNSKKMFFSGEQCRSVPADNPSPTNPASPPSTSEDEKKQRRDSSERSREECAARILAEKNQRELIAQQEAAERQRVSATVDSRVRIWVSGKEGNLRALLSTLQEVLLPGSGWPQVSSSELTTETSIKKVYRKATLCLHPDKLQQRGASVQEKLIADKVFNILKVAWDRFNSQESFFLQS